MKTFSATPALVALLSPLVLANTGVLVEIQPTKTEEVYSRGNSVSTTLYGTHYATLSTPVDGSTTTASSVAVPCLQDPWGVGPCIARHLDGVSLSSSSTSASATASLAPRMHMPFRMHQPCNVRDPRVSMWNNVNCITMPTPAVAGPSSSSSSSSVSAPAGSPTTSTTSPASTPTTTFNKILVTRADSIAAETPSSSAAGTAMSKVLLAREDAAAQASDAFKPLAPFFGRIGEALARLGAEEIAGDASASSAVSATAATTASAELTTTTRRRRVMHFLIPENDDTRTGLPAGGH